METPLLYDLPIEHVEKCVDIESIALASSFLKWNEPMAWHGPMQIPHGPIKVCVG
jgi:hypothetical protein